MKVKRKGAYEYELEWHQNHSALVVKKAVEAHLVYGKCIKEFIRSHDNHFDFMLRVKVPKTARLMWGDHQIQNTTRYFISTDGEQLLKVMAPLAKNPEKDRPIKIHDGYKVTPMNTMGEVKNIDYSWYVEEALKLIRPLYDGVFKEMIC